MKRISFTIRVLLLICLLMPVNTKPEFFSALLGMLGTKTFLMFLFGGGLAAFTAYRTLDTNRRLDGLSGDVKGVRVAVGQVQAAVELRPTTAQVQEMFAKTDASIKTRASTDQLTKAQDQITQVQKQISQTQEQLKQDFGTAHEQVAVVQTQVATVQTQITQGFDAGTKELAALRTGVEESLKKLGMDVKGLAALTKEDLVALQAALADDTGKKVAALATSLDQRMVTKAQMAVVAESVQAVAVQVHAVRTEMVTQKDFAAAYGELLKRQEEFLKFQAVTFLAMSGLSLTQASMKAFDACFTQDAVSNKGQELFDLIRVNFASQDKLITALAPYGITDFEKTVLGDMASSMKVMAARQSEIAATLSASAARAASAAAPSSYSYSMPLSMSLGGPLVGAGGRPQYHQVRSSMPSLTGVQLPLGTFTATKPFVPDPRALIAPVEGTAS